MKMKFLLFLKIMVWVMKWKASQKAGFVKSLKKAEARTGLSLFPKKL